MSLSEKQTQRSLLPEEDTAKDRPSLRRPVCHTVMTLDFAAPRRGRNEGRKRGWIC